MTREDLLDYLDKEGMLCDISLEKKMLFMQECHQMSKKQKVI